MKFEEVLKKYFPLFYTEVDFIKKTYNALNKIGFDEHNTISTTCICRDEIAQPIRSVIKHIWGENFNLSSLAGMFFAGKTGLLAAMDHAPNVGGRERYVYYVLPHIAMDADGRAGVCRRRGREEESVACGSLSALHTEMTSGRINLSIDYEDVEQSLVKIRLLREITYGHVPDLLELTKLTEEAIRTDLEHALDKIVDKSKSDYAVMSGIQIHGPDANYIAPVSCSAMVNGERREITLG